MRDANPLTDKLGLLMDDNKREAKLRRLLADLHEKIYRPVVTDFVWYFNEQDMTPENALSDDWRKWSEFGDRTVWSKKQGHTWLAGEVIVPEAAVGETFLFRVSSQWQHRPGSTDPQCLAYVNGDIAQALDGNHTELVLAESAVLDQRYTVHIDAFTFFDRPLTGLQTEFLLRDNAAEQLYFDLNTPFEVACYLPQTDARRHAILDRVERALRALDRRDGHTEKFSASIAAAKVIAEEIYQLQDTELQPTITAFGHTHIDIAWLWRILHTREKAGRSFATAIRLLDEYPQFIFMYNQAVLFNFLKEDYPDIWARLKEKVRNGQLEIEGAMWVEPDANIVSGESMVRQIMRGRRFHREEFGVVPKSVWLPDTFGYSANMPQILVRSGLEYFITSKLSWNDTDRHPYDTFFWRGIDGTATKAQLITTQAMESSAVYTTYNSDLSVSHVMGAWKRYEPKRLNDELLICYGYGDGGGGPTRAMVERGTRLERGIPGAPKLKLEGLGPFTERLGARMDTAKEKFPVWNGELYLQYHRGTLTSVARNKANNRKAERLMRECEFLASMAFATKGVPYPEETLARLWETVLINQFHDILPGTSIREVYEDSDQDYAALFDEIENNQGLWQTALKGAAQDAALLVNTISQDRAGELVILGSDDVLAGQMLIQHGRSAVAQKVNFADGEAAYAAPANVPALGWTGYAFGQATGVPDTSLSVSASHLENKKVRVIFNANGEITSVFDKLRNRELIREGETANQLIAFEDKSIRYDAWDIEHYFEEQYWFLSDAEVAISVVETGPHRAAIRFERRYNNSKIVQIVSLCERATQIEFDTFVDWHEQHTVLKACFPFDLNSSEIRSEIQFGHVTRATHRNTSWDRARFEASMHRWVDLSEANFGAALINDCKYGYDAVEQLVRITLLRGSMEPTPEPDKGANRMRYALMVHDGIGDLAVVQKAAERFNNPLSLTGTPGHAIAESFSFAHTDAPNVTIETVKKAETGNQLILRVFEHANIRADAQISFGIPIRSARPVNLMEEDAGIALCVIDNKIQLTLRPFEIATLAIEL